MMCSLVVVTLPHALPIAVCIPALYCVFSDKSTRFPALGIAALPLVLIAVPQFFASGLIYACLLVCGVIMCRCIRMGYPGLAVCLPSVFIFALLFVNVLITASHQDIGSGEVIRLWVGEILNEAAFMYEGVMPAGDVHEFRMNIPALKSRIATVFPGMVATTVVFLMWLNLLIISRSRNLRLVHWRCPDWVVAIFILSGVCSLLSHDVLRGAGLNLLILVIQIYFFQGIAIVSFFMTEHGWIRIIRWALYILIVTQVYIMVAVSVLGLFDTWFNFRDKIRTAPKGDGQ